MKSLSPDEPYICLLNKKLFRSNCYHEDSQFFDEYLRLIGHAVASKELSSTKYQGGQYEIEF
jgi:hypothetical protein